MKVNAPDWMRKCPECSALLTALESAQENYALREFEEVRQHLVDVHLAQLPGYAEGCANCQEWQALGSDAEPPKLVPVLGREALIHRAGHLLT